MPIYSPSTIAVVPKRKKPAPRILRSRLVHVWIFDDLLMTRDGISDAVQSV
jgi:hypothetical protein